MSTSRDGDRWSKLVMLGRAIDVELSSATAAVALTFVTLGLPGAYMIMRGNVGAVPQ